MSPYYELSVLNAAGLWVPLARTAAYDRAERWFAVCADRWPDIPLRVMDQPAGIMMALRDDCRVRVVASD